MKQNKLFSTIKRNTVSHNNNTILVHIVRSFSKDVYDIFSHDVGFTETQVIPSDSSCKITEILIIFQV